MWHFVYYLSDVMSYKITIVDKYVFLLSYIVLICPGPLNKINTKKTNVHWIHKNDCKYKQEQEIFYQAELY
jgi:hypothetical protein